MKVPLTIISLNYNGTDDTIECIKSLDMVKTNYHYRVVILDNASNNEEYEKLVTYCAKRKDFNICSLNELDSIPENNKILVHSDVNYGFARGNNEIIRRFIDCSEYILLLNNDTEVQSDFIEKMMNLLKGDTSIKYASCRINNYFNKALLWSCGGTLRIWGNRHGYTERELASMGRVIETPYITGCALFLETEMLKHQGLLSEDFFFGEEDFNFCWRMNKEKIRGVCLNEVLVYHKVSQSSKKSGVSVGKTAGYYVNRIIDMHKFYNPVVWYMWLIFMNMFIIYTCRRNQHMKLKEVKQVLKLVRKYTYNEKLTLEDCLNMGRF